MPFHLFQDNHVGFNMYISANYQSSLSTLVTLVVLVVEKEVRQHSVESITPHLKTEGKSTLK